MRLGHRLPGLAPYVALALVASLLVVYAISARGDDSERPRLHDSGIWVVNDRAGGVGRLDKAIGQMDAAFFAEKGDLDVVQQDAAVVAVDASRGSLSVIDPATIELVDGASEHVPAATQVAMGGGTLAAVDPETGRLWATRFDPRTGRPSVSGFGGKEDVFGTFGRDAAVAVSERGTITVSSAATDEVATVEVVDGGLAKPSVAKLDDVDVQPDSQLAMVGERPVLLSPDGALAVVGGARAKVGDDAVLQQSGPAADDVLVASPDGLRRIDLESGRSVEVGHGSAPGTPSAPVRLGACVYGAWAGPESSVLTGCGGDEPRIASLRLSSGAQADLTFRVNRGQVVLNDEAVGEAFDVDAQRFTSPEAWNAYQKKNTDDGKKQTSRPDEGEKEKAQAKDDMFAARADRTSVVHPLDNDYAPEGQVVRIDPVLSDVRGGQAVVSPDGQVVQVTPRKSQQVSFTYSLDDGTAKQGQPPEASVKVRITDANSAPRLRPKATTPVLKVAAGGEIDIPVLGDWRDQESDPVSVETVTATADGDPGTARVLEGGIIRFTAPPKAASVTLRYAVGDGRARTERELPITVQGLEGEEALAPVARSDIAVGTAQERIEIRPLANDLPGSDPGDPDARLAIFGDVTAQTGGGALEIETDRNSGVVTVTAQEAGTYLLSYQAGFGNAAPDRGVIRVDVSGQQEGEAPLAMPDAANVYGTRAATVDVLANDVDPSGAMLTVESVEAGSKADEQLSASVVAGRAVRIEPLTALREPVTLTYTVNNGSSPAEGQILVTPRPVPEDTSPVTASDRITVRSGGVAEVPVLDNDAAPAGGALHLAADVTEKRAGALTPEDADGGTDPARVGTALVRGDRVRYVAPDLAEGDTITIDYVAANEAGETAPGRLVVEVIGDSETNKLPTPPRLEGRVRAGGQVELQLPAAGADPDGDPVSIIGLETPPEQGRIIEQRGDALVYQAYPNAVGTDEFNYQVRDDRGGTATGTARVGVLPQAVPQPPRAVDDELSAAPGSTVTVDVVANDQVDIGDLASVSLRDDAGTATVSDPEAGLVEVKVPDHGKADVVVPYQLSNGVTSSAAAVTVHPVRGYNNPPVVGDVYVKDDAGERSSIDVLEDAYDPDGPTGALTVQPVGTRPGFISQSGRRITVQRGASPRVVPFTVRDGDGGLTAGSIFVPALGEERPVKRDGAEIRLDRNSERKISLASIAKSSTGGPVRFLTTDAWGSPGDVSARIVDERTVAVSAANGYQGPGAVSFEVALGAPGSEENAEPRTGIVTVPVQVGNSRPVLACASDDGLEVAQDARLSVPLTTLCHVWTSDPDAASSVRVEASISGAAGVDASVDGDNIVLQAGDAARDTDGSLRLTVSEDGVSSAPVTIPVSVVEAAKPRLAPITVADLQAGRSRTIDLRPYFTPGLPGAKPRVLSRTGGSGVRITKVSGSRVTVRAAQAAKGRHSLRVTVTDTTSTKRPPASRLASGRVEVEILNRPAVPSRPVPGRIIRSQEVQLAWTAPEANGAPIDRYQLRQVSNGRTWSCRSTRCVADGLHNGSSYRFKVRAHNKVGWSGWSAASASARANAKPGAVSGILPTRVGNGTISLRWRAPSKGTNGSVEGYRVSWPGHSQTVRSTHARVAGLSNSDPHTFTVAAFNKDAGVGPLRRSRPLHSIGTPKAPAAPRASYQPTASNKTMVTLRWPATSPNGPGPVRYTVYLDYAKAPPRAYPGCRNITRQTCRLPAIQNGYNHWYRVRARNAGVRGVPGGAPRRSSLGAIGQVRIIGTPAKWGYSNVYVTGHDAQVKLVGDIPASHGRKSEIRLKVGGVVRRVWQQRGALGGVRRYIMSNKVAADRRSWPIQILVCNESGRCSASGIRTKQTFGPLRNEHALTLRGRKRGEKARWYIAFDNNGTPSKITMHIARYRNGRIVYRPPNPTRKTTIPGVTSFWTNWKHFPKESDKICLRYVVTDRAGWYKRGGSARHGRVCLRH